MDEQTSEKRGPFCIECAYYQDGRVLTKCLHANNLKQDMVTGAFIQKFSPSMLRILANDHTCGPNGQWFRPKPQKEGAV